ncbi:hypothetical protein BJ138DRAFT_1163390 [Hygrophoropsis aurantiaca]|uniref:Uncharacterized protein n=1 Tax=Hygrophoropsis aurantiaca TaxID=72124 RepID=A0ACB7ZY88_9AGAM|nr:hypothetical protein BJ138DRAFT_1163390 [Hygrophoropsis aurantiaca]
MSAREDRLFLFLGAGCTPREWYHRMSEIVTQYEYESDSDLDEGEDRNTDLVEPAETIPPPPAEVVFEAVGEGHGASSGLYEDRSHSASGEATVSEEDTSIVSAPTTSDFEDVVGSEGYARPDVQADRYNALPVPIEPPTNITHVIYVKDTAYKTWRALIYYCYTGRVAFLPLKSCHNAVARLPSGGRDNRCSPKSMYRLAHKLGITALETSALAAIEEHLSKNNILDEIFSKYTSKYPVIRETEMRILMENRREPEVVQALPRMIQKISQGKMPHAETVLSDVMQKLFQDCILIGSSST